MSIGRFGSCQNTQTIFEKIIDLIPSKTKFCVDALNTVQNETKFEALSITIYNYNAISDLSDDSPVG